MVKGTEEGTAEEKNLVKLLNAQKTHGFWKKLEIQDASSVWAIHVIRHASSKIRGINVKPKADCYLAEGKMPDAYIKKREFYLDEEDVERFNLKKIKFSGISVKRKDSTNYQIHKMNPSTFEKIFRGTVLGAGAAIYCTRASELSKNSKVLKGWNTNWDDFKKYFCSIANVDIIKGLQNPQDGLIEAKKIKEYSNKKIKKIIEEDKKISDFIFLGTGDFDEPYAVHWFYEKGTMKKAGPIPFVITTGSGRSHGDFTIVVKPK